MTPAVWIVLVNWKNGKDTVECLDSVLATADPAVGGVVVCDNDSGDDSVNQTRAWAARHHIVLEEHHWCAPDFMPGLPEMAANSVEGRLRVVLLHTGANLGFAGGNNVGIRYVQQQGDDGPILLLNNDTLLAPGCVSMMAERLSSNPQIGMCGCTVVYQHSPRTVQAWGGASFDRWLARARHIGARASVDTPRDVADVERRLDYILGASLMISRRCLDAIGPLDERYFLYYEEIDWAERARQKGFGLGYASDAVVFHKEGGTIGSSAAGSRRSLLSEHYLVRSGLLFTRKFHPWFLPTVLAYDALQSIRVLLRGEGRRFMVRLRAMCGLAWSKVES